MYIIGQLQFESLIELVNYYEKHPLYSKVTIYQEEEEKKTALFMFTISLQFCFSLKVCLTTAVNEELLTRRGMNGLMDSDEVYASAGYMDPNNFSSHICVKVGDE